MRRGIFWVFLFVLGSSLLGATVFREQVAQAIGSAGGSAPVTEQNVDANGLIRVHDPGTVSVSLTATGSTVKIDPAGNTVSLSATDRAKLDTANTHLQNLETQANKLSFDGSGNLKTTSPAPESATKEYDAQLDVDNDGNSGHFYDFGKTINASLIIVANADDDVHIDFDYNVNNTTFIPLRLNGDGNDGATNYTIPLTQPITVNGLFVQCYNTISDCKFSVTVVGS